MNSSCSVHSQQGCACLPTLHRVPSSSAQADMAQPHRDAPTLSIHRTPANAQQPRAQEKSLVVVVVFFFSFYCWFVENLDCEGNNFPACLLWPSNVDTRKLTKGRNSGGDLTTKGPFYSVQWVREAAREGRRTGWEESWINELKMSWNGGCLKTLGFIKACRDGAGVPEEWTALLSLTSPCPKGLGGFLSAPQEKEEMQTVLIWLHNDPLTVSQNRYCQYQHAGRHRLTAAHPSSRTYLPITFIFLAFDFFSPQTSF